MIRARSRLPVSAILCLALFSVALGKEPARRFVVDEQELSAATLAAAAKLRSDGKLMTPEKLKSQLDRRNFKLDLGAPRHDKISPPDLCDRLRQSTFSVGLLYRDTKTHDWEFNSAVGFVVGADGILCTNHHVASMTEEEADQKAGTYLIAADSDGKVFPVLEILASDPEADTAFIRIDAKDLKPLPIRPGVRPGERVFSMSHPEGEHYLFTEGIVARVAREHEYLEADRDESKPSSRPLLFVNVTTEYAPGSSGGPVVDRSGNVIAQIQSISEPATDEKGVSELTAPVRTCVAAEEIIHLTAPPAKNNPE